MSMVNETRALVELTPRYPTRMVYNKTLFPDGFAYFKNMTARKALAALHTCKAVKVVTDDEEYFPVNRQNVYDVFNAVIAGETPEVDAVDPGVHTIASYFGVQEDITVKAGGVTTGKLCDIMSESLYIYGDVFYMENFTGFNTDKKYQSGWYVVLNWTENEEYTNPTIAIVNEAGSINEQELEANTIVWLGNTKEAAIRTIIEVTATDSESNEQKAYVYCKHLHLVDEPSHYLDEEPATGGGTTTAQTSVEDDPTPVG